MKNLFLLDGASGTGKTDMLDFVVRNRGVVDCSFVTKATTRVQRTFERDSGWALDLKFLSEEEFAGRHFDYEYVYRRKQYGFTREALQRALSASKNVFVIVRNADLIKRLQREFSYINVVPIFIYTDEERLRARLGRLNVSKEELDLRLEGIREAYADYQRHSGIYARVIVNTSDKAVYHSLIEQNLNLYRDQPEVDEKLIFILMKFDSRNQELSRHYSAIRSAVREVDPTLHCLRLDKIRGSIKLADVAREKIAECRLAVIDLSGNSPNVFYELGFAHGIKKECILVAHSDTDLKFYPREYKILIYENREELRSLLEDELHAILEAPITP